MRAAYTVQTPHGPLRGSIGNRLPTLNDFTPEQLAEAEELLAYIEQFDSPQREKQLITWILHRHADGMATAA